MFYEVPSILKRGEDNHVIKIADGEVVLNTLIIVDD